MAGFMGNCLSRVRILVVRQVQPSDGKIARRSDSDIWRETLCPMSAYQIVSDSPLAMTDSGCPDTSGIPPCISRCPIPRAVLGVKAIGLTQCFGRINQMNRKPIGQESGNWMTKTPGFDILFFITSG